jgi:tetratricopeptide (TPR) repeat protein
MPGAADAEREIDRLTGTRKMGFVLLAPEKIDQATHVLRVSATKQGDRTAVHAVVSDVQSQAAVKTWDGVYGPGEWKYAARALAGVVSAGLHLTPLPEGKAVNRQARDGYLAGLWAIRQNSTLAEGLKDLESATAADGDSAAVRAGLAEAELREYNVTQDSKSLAEAREAERQSELRYLDTGIGHRAAADLDEQDKRFEEAEVELLRAIELEPANGEGYRKLGDVYSNTNRFDQALQAFRKAVELEPDYYKNQLSLGQFYLYQGGYKEAVEHLSEAVKLAPGLPDARFSLAEANTETGRFDKALENLMSLKQWGANEHFQLATILMYEGKDAEAIPQLQAALKEIPGEIAFWMQLEIAERRVGHLADSKQAARRGLSLAERRLVGIPNAGIARAFLGYFCARLGQHDRAESETAQALKLGHQLDVIWVAVGTYEVLGEREQALAALRVAAPPEMLDDLKRWPEMADLTADSRFTELTAVHAEKKERRP